MQEFQKNSRKIVINKYDIERIGKLGLNYLLRIEHLAKDLPKIINSTIFELEDGNIEVI